MNKREYTKIEALLTSQIEAAQAIVAQFDAAFADQMDHLTESGREVIEDAWNAAHDVMTGLQAELRLHQSQRIGRNTSTATRELIAQNVD